MPLHAFIVMPYGTKEGIDFDRAYAKYIRPALEQAGFEVFRADQEYTFGRYPQRHVPGAAHRRPRRRRPLDR